MGADVHDTMLDFVNVAALAATGAVPAPRLELTALSAGRRQLGGLALGQA